MAYSYKVVCLATIREGKILLVRKKDRELWSLPGRKIEKGETDEQTLKRELSEELPKLVLLSRLMPLCIVGDVSETKKAIQVICFSAETEGNVSPSAEIEEARFVSKKQLQTEFQTLLTGATNQILQKLFFDRVM